MRIYELGFILKPDLPEEEAQESLDSVKQVLTAGGATIDKVDNWGKRPLAYRVHGFWSGHYVFIRYSLDEDRSLNKELERRLRVADHVIKFMTIRLDEDLKRLEKLQARRAKRQPVLDAKAAARAAEAARAKAEAPGKPEPEVPAPPIPAEAEAATTAGAVTKQQQAAAAQAPADSRETASEA